MPGGGARMRAMACARLVGVEMLLCLVEVLELKHGRRDEDGQNQVRDGRSQHLRRREEGGVKPGHGGEAAVGGAGATAWRHGGSGQSGDKVGTKWGREPNFFSVKSCPRRPAREKAPATLGWGPGKQTLPEETGTREGGRTLRRGLCR
eukprot:scaffold5135_cov113-Isochrysis_galbana.AAC.5